MTYHGDQESNGTNKPHPVIEPKEHTFSIHVVGEWDQFKSKVTEDYPKHLPGSCK